jgi:hypothetical protein
MKMNLNVRLQLEPTPEFSMVEVLYLWEFGGALEALLDDCCVGYRLKRRNDGEMDRYDRDVYEYWPKAFARYRDDPIDAARAALLSDKHVVVTSTDVVSFFDSIDPAFLLQEAFVRALDSSVRNRGRRFSKARYLRATHSLLAQYQTFRHLRKSVGGPDIDTVTGVPIGSLTSRVFANLALASVDAHIRAQPGVILYRRYVDDIVIVATREASARPPKTKAEVLASIFPGFHSPSEGRDGFIAPATNAVFELKEEKTRIHDLAGAQGIDFLRTVRESFSVVSSERRAFLGDVERLTTDIEGVDLFGDGATGIDRIPRLRDADRFTLRRYMASAIVAGLERCALLLDSREASDFLKARTARMLSVLDGSFLFEDFELVLSLLKVALLCDCFPVARRLRAWLDKQAGSEMNRHVRVVMWRGTELRRDSALRAVQAFLARRMKESVATACAIPASQVALVQPKRTLQQAALLRRADLRHLDREEDTVLFGYLNPEQPTRARREYALARRLLRSDRQLGLRLDRIESFVGLSNKLGERIWASVSGVALLLSVKPPRYVDVARRVLARAETSDVAPNIGRYIDECVDALRGTRYCRRLAPAIAVETTPETTVLRVEAEREPVSVRVILANLPVGLQAFKAAAAGSPSLTLKRLRTLDRALRDAQRAAHDAKRRHTPSILVFPELAVPRRWLRALADHAVRENLSLLAGAEYESTTTGLVNQAMGVFPAGRQTAAIVRWTKRYPARREEEELRRLGKRLRPPSPSFRRLIVESEQGRIGVLICSEMLEAAALATLAGRVEVILVPAWNDDTPSFEHAVHTVASLVVHSFVCVANNAEASDSRIVAPIKEPRHERDWCRLVHRGETQVIWGDLPIAELRRVHDQFDADSEEVRRNRRGMNREYRPLPPGWVRIN